MPQYRVLDTNILLLDANNLFRYPGDIIVIPETVLDELDSKKSGLSEIAFQSREVGRILTKAKQLRSFTKDKLNITVLQYENTEIHIVSSKEYPDFSDAPNIANDRRIIYIASELTYSYPIIFVSNDVMCRLRATSLGLTTEDIKDVADVDLEFVKPLLVSEEVFVNIHQKSIRTIDPDYLPENFNYIFSTYNSEQVKPAIIINEQIQVIGKVTEDELRRQDLPPINIEQLMFARAIQEPSIDVVICESLAGSGKSACAISNAIKLCKRSTLYDSIIYIRNSVDDYGSSDEEIGFLSGNDEKLAVYLHPFHDTIDAIIRSNHKASKLKGEEYELMIQEKSEALIKQCNMQPMIALGLRGRTFNNAIVIIDESQNFTHKTLQKVLTRIGKNCKVIVLGSNRQIDSAYLNKYTNALSTLLSYCSKPTDAINIHAVTLNKVVRSGIAEWAENLFSK